MIQVEFDDESAMALVKEIDVVWRLSRRDAKKQFRKLTVLRNTLLLRLNEPEPPEAA